MDKVLLCAIAKQENLYIKEWVEYHLKLGFDHITIYDNNEPDGERISDVVGCYPNVNIIDFRGKHQKSCEMQVAAYNACYKGAGAYDWVMFMDIDEFLWFKDYNSIKPFLEQHWVKKANVIRFHWKCYSDNGKLKYEDLPVMERFTEECKDKSVNYHMKQLYRTNLGTLRIVNVHYTNHVNNIYYPDGKPAPYITTTRDKNIHDSIAHIKHYVTKSLEEYVKIKYARRGVGSSKTRLNLDFYFKYNDKTDEKLKYYKTLINELNDNSPKETKTNKMPYIPNEHIKEAKSFVPQSYYEDKFCPGAPRKTTVTKRVVVKKQNHNQAKGKAVAPVVEKKEKTENKVESKNDSIVEHSKTKEESPPENDKFVVDRIDCDKFLKCKNKIHVLIVDFRQLKYTQHIISNLLIQDTPFDLTVFEQKPDEESKQYFSKLIEEWCFPECELNVVFNSVNAPLNHIWNWFYTHTSNKYLAFLNNDIEICNNFISDAERIFEKEEKCGIIIHPTNRPEYTKNTNLVYEKVVGYPVLQGWDFIMNRYAYSAIPDNLWIWRGDVYLMTNAYNNGWEQFYDVSSPILHYTSSTVDKHKDEIQEILNKDKFYWKELNMKECTFRNDNEYTHRQFNGIYPIDLTKKVIVSFTTWTKRIGNVPGVVEQMMKQTRKPDLIILNLSYEEFKWHKILLRDVFQLERNNPIFKINMVEGENTKVWKKWIPIIDKYNNDLIIPIDDDIVYPDDFIEKLYNKWLENPYNPITGDLVFLGGFLQAHCGAGSLIFRQAFGIYMNDYKKIIDELCASDVFYSFAAYMNGYNYVKEGMNVLKFGRHDEISPYSHGKNKTLPKQPQLMDMDFLTDYYLNNK